MLILTEYGDSLQTLSSLTLEVTPGTFSLLIAAQAMAGITDLRPSGMTTHQAQALDPSILSDRSISLNAMWVLLGTRNSNYCARGSHYCTRFE